MSEKIDWKKQEIGGLWRKEDQDGNTKLLSGRIKLNGKDIAIVIFPNRFKDENPKAPDFRVYLAPDQGTTNSKPAPANTGRVPRPRQDANEAPADPSEVL